MKVPKALALERREKVWKLRQRGYTYEIIAEEVGLSINGVTKILQRVAKEYSERHMQDVDRVKAEQVAELELVGYEAYQAWERSKEAAKIIRQKKAVAADGKPSGVSEVTQESRDQDGDPRYLETYMKSKEHIRKIIGADAATKSEIKLTDAEKLSDDELRRQAREALNEITAQNISGAGEQKDFITE